MKPFTVAHVEHPENTGTAISEHVTPILDANAPNGVRYTSIIGVLWDDHRTPSPSYHQPTELQWLDIPGFLDDEDGEELEEENEEEIDEEEDGGNDADADEYDSDTEEDVESDEQIRNVTIQQIPKAAESTI